MAARRKLRMGMIGGGDGAFIGGVHRIAAALDQQVDLVAGVFSRDWANTSAMGQRLFLDPTRVYRTWEEMAEREAHLQADRRIDFVAIVTPNHAHFGAAKTFLEHGFHVICDKPLTTTIEEAHQLVQLVERTRLVFAVTYNYTGYPLIRHAKQLFRSGEMGVVRKVLVEYLQGWLVLPEENRGSKQAAWRTNPEQSGVGGAIGDIGTHALHLVEYVTGDPVVELCADKSTFLPDRTLDEDVNALLRFRGGGKGVLTVSQIATGEENALRLRVYASKGAILWEQENPNYLELYRHGEPRQTLTRGRTEYLSSDAGAATRIPWGHPEGYLEAFANVYLGAVHAIRCHVDGAPIPRQAYDFPSVYDGCRGVRFIHRAVESANGGGTWVEM